MGCDLLSLNTEHTPSEASNSDALVRVDISFLGTTEIDGLSCNLDVRAVVGVLLWAAGLSTLEERAASAGEGDWVLDVMGAWNDSSHPSNMVLSPSSSESSKHNASKLKVLLCILTDQ
jgi:hypothetical protein